VRSPAALIAQAAVQEWGPNAQEAIDFLLENCSNTELAAHENDWSFWARPKQLPPPSPWQSWGFLTGRGFGKTIALSKYINAEVEAGRAPLILLMAQDEQSAIDIQVKGPSGLIATAPHWFRPAWLASEMVLVWPNGARAYVRTPEVPGKIRGLEYHLAWLSEVQSWPVATREEAYMNSLLSTRLGGAQIVWDATPRKRHPILKKLLKAAEQDPQHVVVRGGTHENPFLAKGYQAKLEAELGGTQRGREELLGEMLSDSDNALIRDEWITSARRPMPERLLRRVIGIDPAVTNRAGNDRTGIVECGLGVDEQVYVLGDYSGRHSLGSS
jgi:phage terminase large subunit-like protein